MGVMDDPIEAALVARGEQGYQKTLELVLSAHRQRGLPKGVRRNRVMEAVGAILRQLDVSWPYMPGDNQAFWLSACGQKIAEIVYFVIAPMAPREAIKMLYPDLARPDAKAKELARRFVLHAYPRPENLKHYSTDCQRRRRGSQGKRMLWVFDEEEVRQKVRSDQSG